MNNKLTNIPTEMLFKFLKDFTPAEAVEHAYILGKINGLELARDMAYRADPIELAEAVKWFSENGISTEDLSEKETIEKYNEALKREANEGDIDINISNEQVT